MPKINCYYDNDFIYAVIEADDNTIEVFRKKHNQTLWQDILTDAKKHGFYVRKFADHPSYFKVDASNQMLVAVYNQVQGYCNVMLGQTRLSGKSYQALIEQIECGFEDFVVAKAKFPMPDDEAIIAEIQAQKKCAHDLKIAEQLATKESILGLDIILDDAPFSQLVKSHIVSHLAPLKEYAVFEIAAFIQAIMQNKDTSDPLNYDIRIRWLFNYDFIANALVDFPNKTIGDYQTQVSDYLNLLLAQLLSIDYTLTLNVIDIQHSKIHGLKTAKAYWLSQLSLPNFNIEADESDADMMVYRIHSFLEAFKPELTAVFNKIDDLKLKMEILHDIGERLNLDMNHLFDAFEEYWHTIGIDSLAHFIEFQESKSRLLTDNFWALADDNGEFVEDYHELLEFAEESDAYPLTVIHSHLWENGCDAGLVYEDDETSSLSMSSLSEASVLNEPSLGTYLLRSLNNFKQDYVKTSCPQYLFQCFWDFCDYLYRLCAWMDTYCLGIGNANHLHQAMVQEKSSHGFFKQELNIAEEADFDVALKQVLRDMIWEKSPTF